jgi:hypothetical protein
MSGIEAQSTRKQEKEFVPETPPSVHPVPSWDSRNSFLNSSGKLQDYPFSELYFAVDES